MASAMDYLWSNSPACVAGFNLEALRFAEQQINPTHTMFALECKCGARQGTILGYSLKSVHKEYNGVKTFVGPLGFSCSFCKKTTEIIDTDVDGYHEALTKYLGEQSVPVTIRGEGARERFQCPRCDSFELTVIVGFYYSGAEQDIEEDGRTGHMEDFFVGFFVQGKCTVCGDRFDIANFVHL